jgi:hypothetical protein
MRASCHLFRSHYSESRTEQTESVLRKVRMLVLKREKDVWCRG